MTYALQLMNDLIIAVEMVKVCAKFHTGLSRCVHYHRWDIHETDVYAIASTEL